MMVITNQLTAVYLLIVYVRRRFNDAFPVLAEFVLALQTMGGGGIN